MNMSLHFETQAETAAAMVVIAKWLKELVTRIEKGIKDMGLVIERKEMRRNADGEVEPAYKVRSRRPGWTIELRLGNTIAEFITLDRDAKPARFDPRLLDDEFAEKKLDELVKCRLELVRVLATSKSVKDARPKIEALGKEFERLRMWEPLEEKGGSPKRRRKGKGKRKGKQDE